MLECPVCDSENVRVSFNAPFWEFFYRWQGLQRYRCRECRKIFHHPLAPGEQFATKPQRTRRTPRKRERAWIKLNNGQARMVEGGLFLLMLVVFYTVLKAIHFAPGQ
jgi:hypothetical protein